MSKGTVNIKLTLPFNFVHAGLNEPDYRREFSSNFNLKKIIIKKLAVRFPGSAGRYKARLGVKW